jgi:cytochrome c6
MRIGVGSVVTVVALAAFSGSALAKEGKGEALFMQHCVGCHANGGNIINAAKTLGKKDREANGVKTAKDIVARMRKPGPGMTQFDAQTIPDKDAEAIAKYILKTFK